MTLLPERLTLKPLVVTFTLTTTAVGAQASDPLRKRGESTIIAFLLALLAVRILSRFPLQPSVSNTPSFARGSPKSQCRYRFRG